MDTIIVLFLISFSIYYLFYFKLKRAWIFTLKVITSALFVIVGFLAYFQFKSNLITFRILFGLVFGLIGDILLGIKSQGEKKKVYFLFGLASFFIGHLFYISIIRDEIFNETAYFMNKYMYILLILTLVISYIIIRLFKFLKFDEEEDYKKLKRYIYLYILVLSLLFSMATVNIRINFNFKNIIIFVATFNFAISDFLLAITIFKKMDYFSNIVAIRSKFRLLKRINMITYYFAQILFAISIIGFN